MPQNQMNDKLISRQLLNSHKLGASSLTNLILESVDNSVRNDTEQILDTTFQHQKMIFDYMNSKGYYQVEMAPQSEITKAQQNLQQSQM